MNTTARQSDAKRTSARRRARKDQALVIRMSSEALRDLQQLSLEIDLSMSQIVRDALREFAARQREQTAA